MLYKAVIFQTPMQQRGVRKFLEWAEDIFPIKTIHVNRYPEDFDKSEFPSEKC